MTHPDGKKKDFFCKKWLSMIKKLLLHFLLLKIPFLKVTMKRHVILLFAFAFCLSIGSQAQTRIEVLSAVVKDKKIEGAEVLIQKNGEQTVIGRTDSNGSVTLHPSFADDNNAMVIIKKEGYSTLVAKCPCEGLTYAISPVMQNLDGIRIVLSWNETPADLDSHLWYSDQHIYYNSKEGHRANLDVDDTDGYGPETITIQEKKFGTEYVYAVHNYSYMEYPASRTLSQSGAKVFVYIGQSLVKTYYIPTDHVGNLWTVFKVTAEGEIEDINSFSGSSDSPGSLAYNLSKGTTIMAANKEEAKRMNNLGTVEYNNKNYPKAIEYYLLAIEFDPDYAQAYGNLGLTYKKNDQYAEVLWANRKAIALASGTNANVTRAGAYYNIGRIYEEREEYAKAKEQYQLAKEQSDKPTYDTAIERMNQLLNQ